MLELFYSLNSVAIGIVYAIALILFISVLLMIYTRIRYKKIVRDLMNVENRANSVFKEKIINKMVEDYQDALKNEVDEVNTPAILDKQMAIYLSKQYLAERIVSRSSSLMIILGLLGTFYGLTLSIGEIVTLLASTKGSLINDMTPIIDGLMNALQGMSVAFVTSLCGISGAIVITVLTMFMATDSVKDKIAILSEEYLDHYIGRGQRKTSSDQIIQSQFMNPSLEITEKGIRDMTETVATHLDNVAKEISNTTAALNGSIERFEKSIHYFSENTRNFAEFNHELRTNIQRMNVTFDDFTGNIQKSTIDLKQGHQVLSNTLEIINQGQSRRR